MQSLTYLLSALALATSSSAAAIDRRAGGPAIVPIPPQCSVTDPTTSLSPSSSNGYQPSAAVIQANSVYSYYGTVNFTICQQQCYGYGTTGTCKSVFAADNAPTPAGYYGTPGGSLEQGCLMFNKILTAEDFVEATPGQYNNYKGANIQCP